MLTEIIEHHFNQVGRENRCVELFRIDGGKKYRLYHGIVEDTYPHCAEYCNLQKAYDDMNKLIKSYLKDD